MHTFLELTDAAHALQACGGEVILLTGDTGSGKSIWLHRMAALTEPPESINITLNGTSPDKQTVRMLFDRYPCVWLGQTVAEELVFGLKTQIEPRQLEHALAAWGLPNTALDAKSQSLNRLQSLRLSLAAMSLAEPALILLDNPTAALSEQDARAIIKDIANHAGFSNTIVVVACNRWHDWQFSASQVWQITAPDALPQTGIQL